MRPRDPLAREAVGRAHTRLAVAQLWRPDGGYVCDVPIHGGQVDWSLSRADGDRAGTLTVPGYSFEEVLSPAHYGWLQVSVVVDGRWTWDLGQFPITATKVSAPGGEVTVTLGDWSYRRSRSVAEGAADTLRTGVTVAAMAAGHLTDIMPWPVTCTRDDTKGAMMPAEAKVSAGGDVWAAMQQAAGMADARLVMPDRSTVQVRRHDPALVPVESLDGLVNRASRTVSAEKGDACNRVVVRVEGGGPASTTYTATRTLTKGPFAYKKAEFGYAQIVENPRVSVPSQAAADKEADRLARRRFGAGRTVEATIVPVPWLEVGDVVSVPVAGAVETIILETVSMPLVASSPMRITGRDTGWTG